MRKRPAIRAFALVIACLLPAACAETRLATRPVKPVGDQAPVPTGAYKVGEPYQIGGIWYYPHEDYDYRENGVASWYGVDFHGKLTANGETYDMNDITAAHRTLPMPSMVRVTNLANGRNLVVRVNDRGPFANDRILDLSRRSAQLLGFEQAGTTRVRVEILAEESISLKSRLLRNNVAQAPRVDAAPRATVASESLPALAVTGEPLPPPSYDRAPPPRPPVKSAAPVVPTKPVAATRPVPATRIDKAKSDPVPASLKSGIFVQAASFANKDYAQRLSSELETYGPTSLVPLEMGNRRMWRVRVGPWGAQGQAERILDKVRKAGFKDARLVVVD